MNVFTRSIGLLGIMTLVATPVPHRATAQGNSERPVFLAMPETFPDIDARVVLMREPGRDIVILHEDDLDPNALRVALMLLKRLDRENPPTAGRTQIVPVTGFAGGPELEPERRATLEGVLADLQTQPFANVGNLGWGRWMRFREP
jgi:hypothetical protein